MRVPAARLLVFGLAAAAFAAGCEDFQRTLESYVERAGKQAAPAPAQGNVTAAIGPAAEQRGGDSIRIASFNIQVFGESKAGKRDVMDVLAKVARRFDVVAIQEVRAKSPDIIPNFVALINSDGSSYNYVIGPRLGRTTSKEQYAFVFDAQRIEVDRRSMYTVDDREDLLHREPFVARFRVRGAPSDRAFTFSLVNIHTDPDETAAELDALGDVFRSVQSNGSGEDDVILLGDLNVDYRKLGKLGRVPGIAWVISGEPTNMAGNKSYDNIVFDRAATSEFAGKGGVIDIAADYGLSKEQALEVSDHRPVWAEFSAYEGGARSIAAGERTGAGR
jgi:endonuclease/exonuclease/phosphatase family metal-dependent hydrolase